MSQGFYHTKASVDLYYKMTENINGQLLIDKLKDYLSPKSSLLELGTGPGHDWKILSKDYKVIGSDLSDEFLARLKVNYPTGEFLKLNAANLNYEGVFDGIYSNKVLHHLKDEELHQSIARQSQLLTEKGVICHSFWKGAGSETFQGMFVNNHTEEDLKDAFQASFEILLLESYQEFEEGDSILLIAAKR